MSEPESSSEKETITLHQLLERSASSALNLQREDGSFPPGRNYTYDEPETPVRTTAHWVTTLSEVYDITGEKTFAEAANAAVDFLLRDEVRPHGYTYYCRDAPGKDKCNGLAGQAGPIRALTHGGLILERDDAIETAGEVFALHPFDDELGLWERVEINGKKLSFDRTLNHQLLFAAGCSKLASESRLVADRIKTFLDRLESNLQLHSDGLIKHYVRPSPVKALKAFIHALRHWRLLLNEIMYHYYSWSSERRKKETGYQPINLHTLALLKRQFGAHPIWKSEKINEPVEFIGTTEYKSLRDTVSVGTTVPGIRNGWGIYGLKGNNLRLIKKMIESDLDDRLDTDSFLLTSDLVTSPDQAATISLLVGLPNIRISL